MEEELNATMHELQVHQEELRTQNDDMISAQKEIERSHKRYKDLFESAPLGYLALDENQVIREINLTCVSMLGYNRKMLIEKPLFLRAAPHSRDILSAHFRAVWKGSRSVDEVDFVRQTDDVFPAEIESVPVFNNKGKVVLCRTALTESGISLATSEELPK